METETETPNRSKPVAWFFTCMALPLFYFLSVGPVALFVEKAPGMLNPTTIRITQVVYAPIIWMDRAPACHKWIEAYLNLWGAH